MKTNHLFIAVFLTMSVLSACNKTESSSGTTAEGIRFTGPVQTKAGLQATPNNNVFQIRDWLNGRTYHLENTLEYYTKEYTWGYGIEQTYPWSIGEHCFFGWLQNDDSYSSTNFFGSGFGLSATAPELSIPQKAMTNSVTQYDFLYSQVVKRNTSENDYSDVSLIFKHLFSKVAIYFKIHDEASSSDEPIYVERVFLENFKNAKSATIDFSTEGDPTIAYDNVAKVGEFASWAADLGLSNYRKTSDPLDVLSQQTRPKTSEEVFYYVWPMSWSELQSTNIKVQYRKSSDNSAPLCTSTLSFPAGTSWEAGNKYEYTITYRGGILKMTSNVLDWDYEEKADATAEKQSVVATWMGWDPSSCNINGTDIEFVSNGTGGLKPIHGMFKIYSPTQCTFHINFTGDTEHNFTISPQNGQIGPGSSDIAPGELIDFYISIADGKNPASSYHSELAFSLTASQMLDSGDRDCSLDSELQRDGIFNIIVP